MLIEIDLLDYLAYTTGLFILSDLRLIFPNARLRELISAIPLELCGEQEWIDAAQYLTGHLCASAAEAKITLVR